MECSSGYYYNQQEGICKAVDPLCKGHNKHNGHCSDCYQGFSLVDGKCVVAKAVSIPHCISASPTGICLECLENYYVNGGKCKAVSILCATYNKGDGRCTSCVTGHFLQEGECIFPALYDPNCVWYQSAYCSECASGYRLSGFMCHAN